MSFTPHPYQIRTQKIKSQKKKHCKGALAWFELWTMHKGGFLVWIFCFGFLFSFLSNLGIKHFGGLGENTWLYQFTISNQTSIKSIFSLLFASPFSIHPKIFPTKQTQQSDGGWCVFYLCT